jgi:type VI secretion system protein VasG
MKLELKKLIDTLKQSTKNDLQAAAKRCIDRGGEEILIEDLLYIFLNDEDSVFNKLLRHYAIDSSLMQSSLQKGVKTSTMSESSNPIFSPALVHWLEDGYMYAKLQTKHEQVSQGILLTALFENAIKYANTAYFALLANIDTTEVKNLLEGVEDEQNVENNVKKPKNESNQDDLKKYTTDITLLAAQGKIDPVLCRDSEIKQCIDILLRRRKNNPILVGEAGVGKTAVVEGLALKIVESQVPLQLLDTKILSLDLGAMQAGASVKGEFERRLQSVIKAVQTGKSEIILFIDESHTLIGAGGNEGGSDAANLLKPALARGELRTIAATTWLEYRKYFEKDPALSRRFQKINVLEPSIEDTVTILQGIADKYESVHGVYIEYEALEAAAKLSARYISGRQLPDKAIDVLDTACANVKISKTNRPYKLQKLHNKKLQTLQTIEALQRDGKSAIKDYEKIIKKFESEVALQDKEIAKLEIEFSKQQTSIEFINKYRIENDKEQLRKEYQALKKLQEKESLIHDTVSFNQIAEVISSWTGIPLGSMVQEQIKGVMTLKEKIKQRVIGQDEAIERINTFLQIATAGLKRENTPTGVFLLVGPSGVGKTETARAIADLLYGGEQFLTTINMTEFQEKHTLSRLIGSPPGYVGYGEGGELTDAVRIKPYSVVLLDEIEKAHPDILNLFYQIFDKGVVNDAEGRSVDFKNTVILMTSNLATKEITHLCNTYEDVDSNLISEAITPILSDYLKPALLGRMNVVPYKNLDEKALKLIIAQKLDTTKKQLAQRDIKFSYDEKVLQKILDLSNATDTGARNIDLVINGNITPKLSEKILQSSVEAKALKSLKVNVNKNNEISIRSSS